MANVEFSPDGKTFYLEDFDVANPKCTTPAVLTFWMITEMVDRQYGSIPEGMISLATTLTTNDKHIGMTPHHDQHAYIPGKFYDIAVAPADIPREVAMPMILSRIDDLEFDS